jgi:hypothetical protein
MRAKSFHSAVGVLLLLAGIAVAARHGRDLAVAVSPTPLAVSSMTVSQPAAPATQGSHQRGRFDIRKTTRAVIISTIPMAPLLEVVAPTRSSPQTAPDEMIHQESPSGEVFPQDAPPEEYIYPEATDQEGAVLIE